MQLLPKMLVVEPEGEHARQEPREAQAISLDSWAFDAKDVIHHLDAGPAQ
jgi:hypothetical protein